MQAGASLARRAKRRNALDLATYFCVIEFLVSSCVVCRNQSETMADRHLAVDEADGRSGSKDSRCALATGCSKSQMTFDDEPH